MELLATLAKHNVVRHGIARMTIDSTVQGHDKNTGASTAVTEEHYPGNPVPDFVLETLHGWYLIPNDIMKANKSFLADHNILEPWICS